MQSFICIVKNNQGLTKNMSEFGNKHNIDLSTDMEHSIRITRFIHWSLQVFQLDSFFFSNKNVRYVLPNIVMSCSMSFLKIISEMREKV